MPETLRRRLWLIAFILFCSTGTILAGWQAHGWGDGLSPVDAYSEANALREVDGFRAQGLTHDAGLGNVLFGSRYPEYGFAASSEDQVHSVTPGGVYTHYPPGPEYLLYLSEAVFGPKPVWRLRLLPLACSGAAAIFFGLSLRRRFGPLAGWLVLAASLAVVPFHDANSSVHFLGYALALLLVEIGVAIGHGRSRVPFVLLAFVQGWLSFDYVFLVVLAPLAVELALWRTCPGHRPRLRLAAGRCAFAAAGFAIAHALHFGEVWAFYGSLGDAVADLRNSAHYRANGQEVMDAAQRLTMAMKLLQWYVISPCPVSIPLWRPVQDVCTLPSFRVLGLTLGPWWLLVAVVSLVDNAWRRVRCLGQREFLRDWYIIGVIGIASSCVWWVVMQGHSLVHVHLLYRHLNVCFLLWTMFLAVRIAVPVERHLAKLRLSSFSQGMAYAAGAMRIGRHGPEDGRPG